MNADADLSPSQYARLTELFVTACDEALDDHAREAIIAQTAMDDPRIGTALRALLASHRRQDVAGDGVEFRLDAAVRAAVRRVGELGAFRPPAFIGPHRIVRHIASGGMGAVYEAEQQEPHRTVALKVLRFELLNETNARRFVEEGNILARLTHPGIARIYGMGTTATPTGTVPYIVMEYIDGVPITEYANEHGLNTASRIALLRKVCEAVRDAHAQGVLHRDLKPRNILVDGKGRPRVLDFGIARPVEANLRAPTMTVTGQFSGTIPYASPEQLRGDRSRLDVRTDVYGLGAVGYELLAGRPPHDVAGLPIPDAIRIATDRSPQPLSNIDPRGTGELSAIFAKALETDPSRRYADVQAFDDDLRRFLDDEPIEARPPSRLYRWRKALARNRLLASVVGASALAVLVVLAAAWKLRGTAREAEARADEDRYAREVETALRAVRGGSFAQVVESLDRMRERSHTWEGKYLRARAEEAIEVVGWQTALPGLRVVSPDHRWLVAYTDAPPGLHIVDLERGSQSHVELERLGPDAGVRFVPERNLAVLVTATGSLHEIDLVAGRRTRVARIDPQHSLELPRDGWLTAWSPEPDAWAVVDLRSGTRSNAVPGFNAQVLHGRYLVRWADDASLTVRDLRTGAILHESPAPQGVRKVALDPRARWLAVLHRGFTILDLDGQRPPWSPPSPAGAWGMDARFEPAGAELALAFSDSTIRVVDPAARTTRLRARDRRLLGGSELHDPLCRFDARTRRWMTLTPHARASWPHDSRPRTLRHAAPAARYPYVYALGWHPRGRWLATAAWDRRLLVWDTWTGALLQELPLNDTGDFRPRAVTWSENGRWLAVQHREGTLDTFGAWDGSVRRRGKLPVPLLAIGDDATLTLWTAEGSRTFGPRVASDRLRSLAPPSKSDVRRCALHERDAGVRSSFEGRAYGGPFAVEASSGSDPVSTFRVWDLSRDTPPWSPTTHAAVLSAALSPRAERLFIGLFDGSLSIYDPRTRRRLGTTDTSHVDYIAALELVRDGTVLASGSGDGTVELWDTRSAHEHEKALRRSRTVEDRVRTRVRQLRADRTLAETIEALARDKSLDDAERDAAFALALEGAR